MCFDVTVTSGSRPKVGSRSQVNVKLQGAAVDIRGSAWSSAAKSKEVQGVFLCGESLAYTLKGYTPVEDLPVPNTYTNSFVICSCIYA